MASGYEEVAWTVDAVREAPVAYLSSLRALRAYITTGQGFATLLVLIEHTLARPGQTPGWTRLH